MRAVPSGVRGTWRRLIPVPATILPPGGDRTALPHCRDSDGTGRNTPGALLGEREAGRRDNRAHCYLTEVLLSSEVTTVSNTDHRPPPTQQTTRCRGDDSCQIVWHLRRDRNTTTGNSEIVRNALWPFDILLESAD